MAMTIEFDHNGKHYTLEYTCDSVKKMEQRGFVISDITEKPMTALPNLFAGAFIEHHKDTNRRVIDEIFNGITNRQELYNRLTEMYNNPVAKLLDEPSEGNVSWAASW
jgi:hypothetical protein